VPEVFQLDVALVDEAGETIIDAAQGHAHVSAELPLGTAGILGQEAEELESFVVLGAFGFVRIKMGESRIDD